MKITSLPIDVGKLLRKAMLVDVTPYFTYENGNKTDKVEGFRYSVCLPNFQFDKIAVKIEGKQLMEKPDGYVSVTFDNPEVVIYWRNGTYDFCVKASGVHASAGKNNQ